MSSPPRDFRTLPPLDIESRGGTQSFDADAASIQSLATGYAAPEFSHLSQTPSVGAYNSSLDLQGGLMAPPTSWPQYSTDGPQVVQAPPLSYRTSGYYSAVPAPPWPSETSITGAPNYSISTPGGSAGSVHMLEQRQKVTQPVQGQVGPPPRPPTPRVTIPDWVPIGIVNLYYQYKASEERPPKLTESRRGVFNTIMQQLDRKYNDYYPHVPDGNPLGKVLTELVDGPERRLMAKCILDYACHLYEPQNCDANRTQQLLDKVLDRFALILPP